MRRWSRRLEGPLQVLRGHADQLVCLAVSVDLDTVVSASAKRGVLLHSITRGRFLRKLEGVERADCLALSPEGLIAVWDAHARRLSVFTINAAQVASLEIPEEDGEVAAMAISGDGLHLVVGTALEGVAKGYRRSGSVHVADRAPSLPSQRSHSLGSESSAKYVGGGATGMGSAPRSASGGWLAALDFNRTPSLSEREVHGAAGVPQKDATEEEVRQEGPSVSFIDIYSLRVLCRYRLPPGSDVTALALTEDNSALLVSTAARQLMVYTDPHFSVRVVDQMLRLGWEGSGFLS